MHRVLVWQKKIFVNILLQVILSFNLPFLRSIVGYKMLVLLLLLQLVSAEWVFTIFADLSPTQENDIENLPGITNIIFFGAAKLVKISDPDPLYNYLIGENIFAFDMDEDRVIITHADWLPDRIDQISLPLDGIYDSRNNGAGVNIYIVDTGVRTSHNEFGSRASLVYSVSGSSGNYCGNHGTSVASVAAGSTVGVARGANIRAVKITEQSSGSCSITLFNLLEALAWLVDNAVAPAVINLSLSGAASSSIDSLVNQLNNRNVVVVAAAGNDGQRNGACIISPARNPNVISVAGSTITDERWSVSNFDGCINYFAPGQSVRAAVASSNSAYSAAVSGTSFSSPAAAGAVAIYMREILNDGQTLTSASAKAKLQSFSISGAISNPAGTPNRLIYVGNAIPPVGGVGSGLTASIFFLSLLQ